MGGVNKGVHNHKREKHSYRGSKKVHSSCAWLGASGCEKVVPSHETARLGRGKQGSHSHGRAELLVEEREGEKESKGLPAMREYGYRLGHGRARSHGRTALQV